MNQGYDHDSFCPLFNRVDDLVGEFFRISPPDISAREFFTIEQGLDGQISPHNQNLLGKPRSESFKFLLILIPRLLEI